MKTKTNADTAPASNGRTNADTQDERDCTCANYSWYGKGHCSACPMSQTESDCEAAPAIGQHTSGPWTFRRDAVPPGHEQFSVYPEDQGYRVATAFQSEANARLIAAAPELLAQLKRAVQAIDVVRIHCTPDKATPQVFAWWDDILKEARAAIAKADRGEA